MIKFYRCKRDNFLWKEGAILYSTFHLFAEREYRPINSHWNQLKDCYQSLKANVVEDSPADFEPVSIKKGFPPIFTLADPVESKEFKEDDDSST